MKTSTSCFLLFALAGLCLLNCLAPPFSFGQAEKAIVFFYSSESNINNFKSLKMEFDGYFAKFGAYEFQPFSEKHTFEQQIDEQQNCLILLSSWHYNNIRDAFHLMPLLVGLRNGYAWQKRLLVASGESTDLNALKSGQIASAGSIQYTRMLLNGMFGNSETVEKLRILIVPKDIDALMSIGFGMAKAAITTDYSLEILAKMNPALYKKISILAESQESRLLILAAPKRAKGHARQLATIFQEMASEQEGRKKLRMLGLDGWKTFDANDATDLEN
ncbi:MAG: phosphate/phosphite/phosphonate ABC transporter substrate-binding protein [bacterium]|nr:phosphate/phosphite/phosphonate ABC transporter substrate-binding protein [bacterium]